jgi:transposase
LAETGDWKLSIVKRSDQAEGFVVLPMRWIVERTLSWLSRCRRLVRHHELYLRTSAAFIRLAMIRLMLRRLARK